MKFISLFLLITFIGGTAMAETTQEKLDALKAKFVEKAPKEKIDAYEKGIKDVRATGVEEKAKNTGDTAPDFTLPDPAGKNIQLSAILKDGPVVLVWYRGGWCPYCNIHLHEMQRVLPAIKAAGGNIIAISPELPDNSLDTKQKDALDFYVLSDVGNKVAEDFGVVYTLPDNIAEAYQNAFGLNEHNGDKSNTLPLSASYVIDTNGKITYAFIDADYRNRAEADTLLEEVKKLQ